MLVSWRLHCSLTRPKAAVIARFSHGTVQRYVAAYLGEAVAGRR
jgi:hypothetical protein